MQVCRASIPTNWCPPIQPEVPGTEGLGLLQLGAKKSTSDTEIKLDMQPAIQAFEWIDLHLFLPTFTVPDDLQLHPHSRQWIDLPIWELGVPCDTLCIYLDGSFCPMEQYARFAVAAFVRSQQNWYQAGMISRRV